MRHVSSSELDDLLPMSTVVRLMREAFVEHAHGRTVLPDRAVITMPGTSDVVLVMPGALPALQAVGVKVVSVFPGNPARHGLPVITGTVFAIDPATGEVSLSMDGTWITAKRTGAVSGLATDLLARADARRLLVFGTGPQARTQVEAVCAVRDIEQVVVAATSASKAAGFAAEGRARDEAAGVRRTWRPARDLRDAVADADVIVTATSARTPVFDGAWLQPGSHVNAIGTFTIDARELDTATISRGRVFVDDRTHAWREAGDLRIPAADGAFDAADIRGDLAELVAGRSPGRTSAGDITVFKSVGLAIEDAIVAGWVRMAMASRPSGDR